MEVGSTDKANDGSDDTKEFDFIVRGDAINEVVGDLFVEDNDEAAG